MILLLLKKKIQWHWHRLDRYIFGFCLLTCIGYIHSFFVPAAIHALAFSTLKNYALYAVIYIFFTLLVTTRDEWQVVLRWFAIGGIGLFFFLFYGMYLGQGLWSEYTPLSTLGSRLIAGTHIFYMVLFGFLGFSTGTMAT